MLKRSGTKFGESEKEERGQCKQLNLATPMTVLVLGESGRVGNRPLEGSRSEMSGFFWVNENTRLKC